MEIIFSIYFKNNKLGKKCLVFNFHNSLWSDKSPTIIIISLNNIDIYAISPQYPQNINYVISGLLHLFYFLLNV